MRFTSRIEDLSGRTFGRLTVTERDFGAKGRPKWWCRCECGTVKSFYGGNLRRGLTTSCGCYRRERSTTHGKRKSPMYDVWNSMRTRCDNPNDAAFANYGGRGIKVCERWRESFENFLADMGERPSPKHSIDRIDNDIGYSPENCRWATRSEQASNKRTNVWIEHDGQTKTLAQWADDIRCPRKTLCYRVQKMGGPAAVAFSLRIAKEARSACL